MLTIADQITDATATIEPHEITDTLTRWYPDAPAEVTDALASLETAARRGQWERVSELAAYLNLTVTR